MERINADFLALIKKYLLRAEPSERSKQCVCDSGEWEALFSLAFSHRAYLWLYDAAGSEESFAELSEEVRADFKKTALRLLSAQAQKSEGFLRVYPLLAAQGITAAVLKGPVCDALYPLTDYRTTSDFDLLVSAEDAEQCARIFAAAGLEKQADEGGVEVFAAQSGLKIELHTALFDDKLAFCRTLESWFAEGWRQRGITESFNEAELFTFPPTDHLLYLIAHAFKHFAASGFGIRQVCDIALFSREYARDIDWNYIFERLAQVRAELFYLNLLAIGESELGIKQSGELRRRLDNCGGINTAALLEDILAAGVYGRSSAERLHSARITQNAIDSQGASSGVLRAVFPPLGVMKTYYGFLEKAPFLLVFAWLMRCVSYVFGAVFRRKNRRSSPKASLEEGKKRTRLMQQYGIIDDGQSR